MAEPLHESVRIDDVTQAQRVTRGAVENVIRVQFRVKDLGPFTEEFLPGEFNPDRVHAVLNGFAARVLGLGGMRTS